MDAHFRQCSKIKLRFARASAFALAAFASFSSLAFASASVSTCSAVFAAPPSSIVAQLAKLRVEIETKQKSGDTILARMLYADFRAQYLGATQSGVDLSQFETYLQLAREGKTLEVVAEVRREDRAKDQLHSLNAPTHEVQVIQLGGSLLFSSVITADGKSVIYTSHGNEISIRDLSEAERKTVIPVGLTTVRNLKASSDSSLLTLVGTRDKDEFIAVLDLVTGTKLFDKPGRISAFSSDGNQVAIAQKKKIFIYDSRTGAELSSFDIAWKAKDLYGLEFSPDSSKLAIVQTDDVAKLWDVRSGTLLTTMDAPAASKVKFSPDGQTLVVGSRKTGELFFYHPGDAAHFLKIQQPIQGIRSVAFSPDGQFLYSANHARGLHVWRLADHKLIETVKTFAPVDDLSLSRDGLTLAFSASGGANIQTVRIFGMPPRPNP